MIANEPLIHLVDDELEIRTLYRKLFESRGYSVQTYVSAEEFLGTELEIRTGSILLDFNFPNMNGLEL